MRATLVAGILATVALGWLGGVGSRVTGNHFAEDLVLGRGEGRLDATNVDPSL